MSHIKIRVGSEDFEILIKNGKIFVSNNQLLTEVLNLRYRFDIEDSFSPAIPDRNKYLADLLLRDFTNSKITEWVKPEHVLGRVY